MTEDFHRSSIIISSLIPYSINPRPSTVSNEFPLKLSTIEPRKYTRNITLNRGTDHIPNESSVYVYKAESRNITLNRSTDAIPNDSSGYGYKTGFKPTKKIRTSRKYQYTNASPSAIMYQSVHDNYKSSQFIFKPSTASKT